MSKDKMTPEFYTTLPWRIAAQDYKTAFYLIHGKREDSGELQILTIKDGPHPVKEHLDRMRDNANGIVSAINNTYGAGINPKAVPDLISALKEMIDSYERQNDWVFFGLEDAKAAIEKAKL